MTHPELTERAPAATILPMQGLRFRMRRPGRRVIAAAIVVGGAAMLGGCISVNAPDKPIVIELNINVKQEVIYRLAQDAEKTIQEHPEIF